jgi:hypothetical protein
MGTALRPFTTATFYELRARYRGIDLSDTKRLKQLEDEVAKLKPLVANDAISPARKGSPALPDAGKGGVMGVKMARNRNVNFTPAPKTPPALQGIKIETV